MWGSPSHCGPLSYYSNPRLHSSLLVSHPTQQHKLIDFEGLRDHLSIVDWSPVLSTNDVNVALTSFLRSLSDALGKPSSPQKTASRRNGKPWFNQYLLRLRRQRDRLFHRSKHLGKDHRLSLAYWKIRNLYVAEFCAAEKNITTGNVQICLQTLKDHHRWWGTAKSLCGIRTSRCLPTLVFNGSPVSSPPDKAECLNNFFADHCTTMSALGDSISPVVNAPTINATFSFEPVTSLDVLKKLKLINPWKSPGPDLRGAWRDRDPNDLFAHCSLIFYFLNFKFPTLFVLLNFILWLGSFFKFLQENEKYPKKPPKTP